MNIKKAIIAESLKTLKLALVIQLAMAAPVTLAIEEFDVEGGCPKDKAVKVDIPAQTMENSLSALAQQSGFQVVFYSKDARNISAKSIAGEFENCFAAINTLLEGTGLGYYIIDEQTISIRPVENSDTLRGRDGILLAANGDVAIGSKAEREKISESETDYINSYEIEEIVVTANKRKQNLQDTAMSISALSSEEIERRSLVNMDDYLNSIPGVSAQAYAPGANKIVMRGVGAGLFEDATVAMYFGEVPVNVISPISAVTGSVTDLKLVDIERVEVLRGPQGTLYGSGSMGGTVRNIPAVPKLQEFEGKLSPGYSNTAGYGGSNTKISGMINIPLIENELAFRVVAYNHKNSGYIKNVSSTNEITTSLTEASGAKVNQHDEFGDLEYNGIRATLLWSKGDLDISLMALTQELEQEGLLRGNLALGAYEANPLSIDSLEKRGEFAGDDTDIYNLVIEYDFGLISLLSSSSWQDGQTERGFDLSRSFPLAGAIADNWRREGFTQEIRLNSQWDSPFQIIGGFYYEDIKSSRAAKAEWIGDDELCCGFLGAADPRNLFTLNDEVALKQKAIFSELSYKFTDQLMVTYGARWFDYERDDSMARDGAFNGGVFTYRELDSGEDDTSLMANLTYAPDKDSLLYLQWSQGFRLGKPVQPPPPAVCDVNNDGLLDGTNVSASNSELESDTLDSYELGGKFTLLDNALVINASIYRIEWQGIPVFVTAEPSCGFEVQLNAGEAVSQGIEFESTYYATLGLKINVGASYVNAELSKDSANLGEKGTRLPGSPEWNAHTGLQYDFFVGSNEAFLRADYTYISGYHDDISASFPEVGDYGTLSMRAGIEFNKLNLELYGTNLTNVDNLVAVQFGTEVFRLPPRTLGVELGYYF